MSFPIFRLNSITWFCRFKLDSCLILIGLELNFDQINSWAAWFICKSAIFIQFGQYLYNFILSRLNFFNCKVWDLNPNLEPKPTCPKYVGSNMPFRGLNRTVSRQWAHPPLQYWVFCATYYHLYNGNWTLFALFVTSSVAFSVTSMAYWSMLLCWSPRTLELQIKKMRHIYISF